MKKDIDFCNHLLYKKTHCTIFPFLDHCVPPLSSALDKADDDLWRLDAKSNLHGEHPDYYRLITGSEIIGLEHVIFHYLLFDLGGDVQDWNNNKS